MSGQARLACVACAAEMPADYAHCDVCGAALSRACPSCGGANRPAARFCGQCGHALTEARPATEAMARPTLERAIGALQGERKLVTVLFADVRGSLDLIRGLDPEEAGALLDPAVRAMVEAVRRYGGTVNRVQGDGIMALFGAPVAREDHAERACLAAWHLLQTLPGQTDARVVIRVGINSGPVLIKAAANDFALDYDAIGETAHVANRMEQLATPGTALMTAATYRLAAETIAAEALGDVAVKGVPNPVPAFRLQQPRRASDRWQARRRERSALSPFVGRRIELAALHEALERVLSAPDDAGRFVGVVGDAGIGKSRLVHEFCARAERSATVLRTGAGPRDENAPFRLIGTLLRHWIGVADGEPAAPALDRFAAWLGAGTMRGAALRFLLDLPPEDPAWDEASAGGRRAGIRDTILAAIARAAAERPLVLVAEDLHWCDPDSLELLDTVVETLPDTRAMLVTTSRPDGRARRRLDHMAWIDVRPLERDEAEDLVGRIVGDAPALSALRRRVAQRTEGTPLFIEETVRMVLASPSGAAAADAALEIPDSVQAVIAARIDGLGAQAREVLRMAAVIGRDFAPSLLAEVTDQPLPGLNPALRELLDSGFLRFVPAVGEGTYRFTHALTQAVAYEGVLRRQRQPMHARVLAAMEASHAGGLDDMADLLADHALNGGEPARGADYLVRAGRRANAHGAYAAARTFFERAVAALAEADVDADTARLAIEARLGLRVALLPSGAFREAIEHLDEAETLARRIGSDAHLVTVKAAQCNMLALAGELSRAVAMGEQGHAAARRLADPAGRLSAAFSLGQAFMFAGDVARGRAVFADAMPLIEANETLQGPTVGNVVGLCLGHMAYTLALGGAFVEARRRAATQFRVAEATRRTYDRTFARIMAGAVELTADALDPAVALLTEAVAMTEEARHDVMISPANCHYGVALARLGRLGGAERALARAEETAGLIRSLPFLMWARAGLAELAMLAGERRRATELATAVAEESRLHRLGPSEVDALYVLAATAETPVAAARHYARAARVARRLELWPGFARACGGLATALAACDRPVAAAFAAATAENVASRLQTCESEPRRISIAA